MQFYAQTINRLTDMGSTDIYYHEVLSRPSIPQAALVNEADEIKAICMEALFRNMSFLQVKSLFLTQINGLHDRCMKEGSIRPTGLNFSPLLLLDTEVFNTMQTIMNDAPALRNQIYLEITEGAHGISTLQYVNAINAAQVLYENGYVFGIDDFGSGCANFDILHLWQDVISFVKLDGDLWSLANKNNTCMDFLTNTVNYIANGLHKSVIIEKIEDENHVKSALQTEAAFGQGFHLSPPEPYAELSDVLFTYAV